MGIRSALVAASGDLAFGDPPPGQSGWKIGVDSLDAADKPFTRVLLLKNAAVSTSGGEEQHLDAGGKRYSHIIDPKTGMGLETDITVTTIAKRGLMADPAATAVSVLGCEEGLAFIEKQPELAAFILENSNGQAHALESTSFKSLVKEPHGYN
jgi:thiamine biosynthesis lipoprotein